MKKELLYLYIQNHLAAFYIPPFIIAIFLWLKLYLYGYPEQPLNHLGAILILIAGIFYVRQRHVYKNILKHQTLSTPLTGQQVFYMVLNKIGYTAPFLAILFYPYQTGYIFDHLLGFVFVFLSIAAAAALSPPSFFMLIAEIAFQFLAACLILFLNWGSIEPPYILSGLILFTGYALFIGYKLHISARELVHKNIELAKTAAEAKQANMAKSDFLSMISHEIRTPMHGILSTIDHLKETPLDQKQKDSLDIVTRCSKTLLNMLNDILDLSKIEAKKIKIEYIDFNFHALIHDVLNIVRHSAEEKGLDLEYDLPEEMPQYIHSDPVRLQQIILNLLNNAIKFTNEGFVSLLISVREDIDQSPLLLIKVKDTGIGIDKKDQAKLFERFEQADLSTTRQYGGTGLGLSIVKELSALLKGICGVQSQKNKGSTFWVEIPFKTAKEPIKPAAEKAEEPAPELPENLKVLIAEDNLINQKSIERILQNHKCKTDIVENGQAAIDKTRDNLYDLILMDMNMPVMNGIESAKKIKAIRDVPIIGLTATTEEEMIKTFYEAGISDHITKPFSKMDLLRGIAKNIKSLPSTEKKEEKPLTIQNKLEQILDDFGEDFFFSFIEDSLGEIDRLHGILNNLYDEKSFETMHQFAHDICAVAGNIGMKATHDTAKIIENDCLQSRHDGLNGEIKALSLIIEEEKALVQIIIKNLKDDV